MTLPDLQKQRIVHIIRFDRKTSKTGFPFSYFELLRYPLTINELNAIMNKLRSRVIAVTIEAFFMTAREGVARVV